MSKSLFERALAAEGITGTLANLARSIYEQESSGGKNTKNSNAGHPIEVQAHGGMQILPGTFKEVADKGWNINDPMHNARAGIRYLKKLDKLSGGVPELTAAGYYGGPGGIIKAKQGIGVSDPRNPEAPDTLRYGQAVADRAKKFELGQSVLAMPDDQFPNAVVQGEPAPALEQIPVAEMPATPSPQIGAIQAAAYDNPWKVFQRMVPTVASGLGAYGKNVINTKPNFAPFTGWKTKL